MSSFTRQVPSGKAAIVRIIDSTSNIDNMSANYLMQPEMSGFDIMSSLPTWSFLIEHESGRKLLFDLGIPTDWREMAPNVSDSLKKKDWVITVDKPTVQILSEHNIDPTQIEAVVWSHWHWDHIGNPGTFPSSTKVIVGPGFKEEKLPAYPTNPKADVRESDFEGRELHEITFTEEQSLQIGPFRAYDYFSDGSFYLLDTPGHTVGHLAGLARTTTSPPTFIFMGGDLTHHAGELRPSQYLPLPASSTLSQMPALAAHLAHTGICPGALLEEMQTSRDRTPAATRPFFDPKIGKDIPLAIETIKKTQVADADDNVLYIFAHDDKIRGLIDLFPKQATEWKQRGWGEQLTWKFLDDFEAAVKVMKEKIEQEGSKL